MGHAPMSATRRRLLYVTGTRADFGLMERTLRAIMKSSLLELGVIVTGMHLSPRHGETVHQIEAGGFPIVSRVHMLLQGDTGGAMAKGIGLAILSMTQALEEHRPDVLLVLGDRGEMLAGALAAAHLNIPVAHVHGGEVTGSIDESVRHAITKLAHIHMPTTRKSAERIRRMGEDPARVHIVGAPGLDDVPLLRTVDRSALLRRIGLPDAASYIVVVFHPVTTDGATNGSGLDSILRACSKIGKQIVLFRPNSDAGNESINRVVEEWAAKPGVHVLTDLPRLQYLGLLSGADALVGNSSSGIIETPSLGVPSINVGSRQNLRERNPSTLDAACSERAVERALRTVFHERSFQSRIADRRNVHGDGKTAARIVRILETTRLSKDILEKRFRG